MTKASIIVATKNREDILKRALAAMLKQNYRGYEIIVVSDGSTDNTAAMMEEICKRHKNVKFINNVQSKGPATARNAGIRMSRAEYVVIMDDDCIPEKNWLRNLLEPFKHDKKIGIVSSYGYHGGTSTAYRKNVLVKAGLFDEEFPENYREDTDTVFKILDLGYIVKLIDNAKFEHFHKQPNGLLGKIKYCWKRVWIHKNDVLLFKKHPKRTADFLDIRFGFLRNPWKDFEIATGLWEFKKRGKINLSSPQGVTLIENRGPLHFLLILLGGVTYVFLVKLARLYGSIKYGKFLI